MELTSFLVHLNMKKKICIVIRSWFPNHQSLFEKLSLLLEPNNVEIRYCLLGGAEHNRPWDYFEGVSSLTPRIIEGFRGRVLGKEVFLLNDVNKVLEEINPDILVLSPWSEQPLHTAKEWAKRHNKTCIGWVMGPRQIHRNFFDRIRGLISQQIIRKFVAEMDEIFCYGNGVSAEIHRITGFPLSRMTCVKHSVDGSNYEIPTIGDRKTLRAKERTINLIPSDQFIFGFVGQLIARKGIATLLKSCQELANLGHDFKLYLLGRGPLLGTIRNSELYKIGKIVMFSRLETRDLRGFYSMVDCMIVPSIFDDWCTVVNESFHSRTPVICSTGAYSHFDLIEDGVTGLKFKAGDSEQLLERMELAISHPDLLEEMTNNAYNVISNWTIDDSAQIWHSRLVQYLDI